MITYPQLEAEIWWRAEDVPLTMKALRVALCAHFAVPLDNIGFKGNNLHLRGYHRSRNWIKNSVYCTNRTYSVSRTPGDRTGGDGDWICAIDISLPPDKLIPMCKRLDLAIKAGRLEKITEWYGNDDGDNRVDGYDNIANRAASSDSSHLTHAHLSFDRGRANEDHTDVFRVLAGKDEGDDFMAGISDKDQQALIWRVKAILDNTPTVTGGPTVGEKNALHDALATAGVTITPQDLAAVTAAAETGAEKGASDAVDGATIHVGD